MQLAEFERMEPLQIQAVIKEKVTRPLGVAMPFNGTRRWYLRTYNLLPEAMETRFQDYSLKTRNRMYEIIEMLFEDGVTALYTPSLGRALAERGPEYMEFMAEAMALLADQDSIAWYRRQKIWAGAYGELSLLPEHVQSKLDYLKQATREENASRILRYGIFADKPAPDLIARTIGLYHQLGAVPTEGQLIESYYGAPPVEAMLWIGSDQPTVFDVPLVLNGNTALYFLQFPTLFLDRTTWRRLLYDFLFVRGDEETLYPENITEARQITGLGIRRDGYWVPTTV